MGGIYTSPEKNGENNTVSKVLLPCVQQQTDARQRKKTKLGNIQYNQVTHATSEGVPTKEPMAPETHPNRSLFANEMSFFERPAF